MRKVAGVDQNQKNKKNVVNVEGKVRYLVNHVEKKDLLNVTIVKAVER